MKSGERAMDQSVIMVRTSSRVRRDWRGWPQPGVGPEIADGEHVGVRPVTWTGEGIPFCEQRELVLQAICGNCGASAGVDQTSHISSEMRQSCALRTASCGVRRSAWGRARG